MRTTLKLDPDVLIAVKKLARRQRKTASQIVSQLLRKALNQDSGDSGEADNFGFRPFPSRGGVVTNTLIDELRKDCGD